MDIPQDAELRFQRISQDTLPELMDIEHEAYPDPWSQAMFLQEMTNGASHFYLAFLGDALAGYAGFWQVLDEAHITKLTVAAPLRGKGLGKQLLKELCKRATEVGALTIRLEVRESNVAAQHLYEHAGFTLSRRRKNYYSRTGEDALEMAYTLQTSQPELQEQ